MLAYYLLSLDSPEDKDLFEALYLQHRKQMICIAYDILKDQYDAEDAVHNAFVAIANKFSVVKGLCPGTAKSYFCRAARNCAINMYTKKKREVINEEPLYEGYEVADSYNNIEHIFEKESFEDSVEAIRELPDTYRDTLYLFFVEELSASEIALKLNRRKATVKKQLVRGKKLLIDSLTKKGIQI